MALSPSSLPAESHARHQAGTPNKVVVHLGFLGWQWSGPWSPGAALPPTPGLFLDTRCLSSGLQVWGCEGPTGEESAPLLGPQGCAIGPGSALAEPGVLTGGPCDHGLVDSGLCPRRRQGTLMPLVSSWCPPLAARPGGAPAGVLGATALVPRPLPRPGLKLCGRFSVLPPKEAWPGALCGNRVTALHKRQEGLLANS